MSDLCPICGEPLDESRPWQESLDGPGVQADCLTQPDDEEEEPNG